jgi:2-polyprenyl-3-methyl-5-hydroxy-6-metoxy-1,4-benzoquinol methylase
MDTHRKFWETSEPNISHIGNVKHRIEKYTKDWSKLWFDLVLPVQGKTIVDYGTGAGILGYIFLKDYGLEKYIGIDIAQRQLDAAKATCALWEHKTEFHLLPYDLSQTNADMLICQAVMQHFFSPSVFEDFGKNVNDSGIPFLMLQWRNGPVKFNITSKKDIKKKAIRANTVDYKFVEALLPNYEMTYLGEPWLPSNYIYSTWELK